MALAKDQQKEAIQHFEDAVQFSMPNASEIRTEARRILITLGYSQKNFPLVATHYQALIEEGQPVAAASAMSTAMLRGDNQFEGIRHLQLGLKLNPRNPDLRASYGEALEESGDRRRATKELRRAVKGDPSLKRVYELLGDIYISGGKYQEAIKTLQRELWLAPEDHNIYRKLADLYFRTGSLVQANKQIEKALKKAKKEKDDPQAAGFPDLLSLKAGILIANKQEDEAEKLLIQAADLTSESDLNRMTVLANLFLGIDRPRHVIDIVNKTGSPPQEGLEPRLDMARATAHLLLGDAETAESILRKTLAASTPDQDDNDLPLLLASILIVQRDLDGALDAGLPGFSAESARSEFKLFLEACRGMTERLPIVGEHLALALTLKSEPSLRPIAASNMESVTDAFPRIALPSILLAPIQAEMGQLDQAIATLRNQIRNTPGFLPLYFQLGDLLVRKDKPTEALTIYDEAEAVDPTNAELFLQKGLTAMDELAQASTSDKNPARARNKVRERTSLRVAERNLRKSLELDPEQPKVRLQLGNILVRLERFQEAFLELRKAIRLDPGDVQGYAQLREILPKLPSGSKAAADLAEEMIQRFPDRTEGHLMRARLSLGEGEVNRAREAFLFVLERDPFSAAAHSGLASLHLREGRTEQAISYLQASLMCDPGRWSDAKQLAEILDERSYETNDSTLLNEAIKIYELSQYFQPNDLSVTKRLMLVYLVRDQVDRTIRLGLRAARLYPGDAAILTMLGRANLKKERLEDADRYLRQALLRTPDDPEIHFRLGYVLERRGIKDEAKREYTQALHLAGPNPFTGRETCEKQLSSLNSRTGKRRNRGAVKASPDN